MKVTKRLNRVTIMYKRYKLYTRKSICAFKFQHSICHTIDQSLVHKSFTKISSLLTRFRSAKPRNLEMTEALEKSLKKIARQQKHSSGDDHEKSWIGQNAIRFFFQQFYDNYLQYKYTTMNVCLTS